MPIHFQFARKHSRQPEFIERTTLTTVHAKQPEASAAQAVLPFSDPPADEATEKPKEAFVWDESKGIE